MKELLFGTAGIPKKCKKRDTTEGIKFVRKIGLDCMELEFVYGVKMGEKKAKEVHSIAKSENIKLTAHAPYYINLNSQEEEKRNASMMRILSSARIGSLCGAESIAFHCGFYPKEKDKAIENAYKVLSEVLIHIEKENIKAKISPETMGKVSSFGSLDELIQLHKFDKRLSICLDFAHIYAGSFGKINDYKSFCNVINKVKDEFGEQYLNQAHIHISGIEYSKKGEKKHLQLRESDFNYKDLIKALVNKKVFGFVICESPILEEDALKLKDYYYSLI